MTSKEKSTEPKFREGGFPDHGAKRRLFRFIETEGKYKPFWALGPAPIKANALSKGKIFFFRQGCAG